VVGFGHGDEADLRTLVTGDFGGEGCGGHGRR
jgi:hypothetical protein